MKSRNPRCRQCGKPLRLYTWSGGPPSLFGCSGRGHFCSLRCGWRFAIDAVEDTPGTPGGSLRSPISEHARRRAAAEGGSS
ncbi:MAG TPA: hypothetical protein VGI39_04950 [Polyangiaceae bacterium]